METWAYALAGTFTIMSSFGVFALFTWLFRASETLQDVRRYVIGTILMLLGIGVWMFLFALGIKFITEA